MHEGSSSLTRDRTWAPCIGSSESQPLRHQGSPWNPYSFCVSGYGLLLSSFIPILGTVTPRARLPVPDCVPPAVSCGPPPELPLARVFGRPRLRYEVDTVLRYRCREGLAQRNLPLIRCQENGRWEPPQISCVPRRPVSARRRQVGDRKSVV